MKQARTRNEAGALGGIEGLAFGVLIFVFGTLMITSAWAVIDTKVATSASAREAARAYVEASSESEGSREAEAAATQAMAGHGRTASRVQISPRTGNSAFRRCVEVQVQVDSSVPRIALPLIGRRGGTTTVTSTHSEIVDPYRSGLPGEAEC